MCCTEVCNNTLSFYVVLLSSVNHKDIGFLYVILGVFVGLVSGLLSLLLRIEICITGDSFLYNHSFNTITSVRAAMMILFILMPFFFSAYANIIPRCWLIFPALAVIFLSSVVESSAAIMVGLMLI